MKVNIVANHSQPMTSRKYYIVVTKNDKDHMSVWDTYVDKTVAENSILYLSRNYSLSKVWIQEIDVQEPPPPPEPRVLWAVYNEDGFYFAYKTKQRAEERIRINSVLSNSSFIEIVKLVEEQTA